MCEVVKERNDAKSRSTLHSTLHLCGNIQKKMYQQLSYLSVETMNLSIVTQHTE